jgi:hypothetical protein
VRRGGCSHQRARPPGEGMKEGNKLGPGSSSRRASCSTAEDRQHDGDYDNIPSRDTLNIDAASSLQIEEAEAATSRRWPGTFDYREPRKQP